MSQAPCSGPATSSDYSAAQISSSSDYSVHPATPLRLALVPAWHASARTTKRKCASIISEAHCSGTATPGMQRTLQLPQVLLHVSPCIPQLILCAGETMHLLVLLADALPQLLSPRSIAHRRCRQRRLRLQANACLLAHPDFRNGKVADLWLIPCWQCRACRLRWSSAFARHTKAGHPADPPSCGHMGKHSSHVCSCRLFSKNACTTSRLAQQDIQSAAWLQLATQAALTASNFTLTLLLPAQAAGGDSDVPR